MELTWDRKKASELLSAYRARWDKGREYGIQGKADQSGKPNPATVYDTVLNYTSQRYSRDGESQRGAGELLALIEELAEDEQVSPDEITQLRMLRKIVETQEGTQQDPRYTPFFNQPVAFADGKVTRRATVYGHFLTEAYQAWRRWKSENREGAGPYTLPTVKDSQGWWSETAGKGNPPLYQAIYGDNGLIKLANNILLLAQNTSQPKPNVAHIIHLNRTQSGAAMESLTRLSGARAMLQTILSREDIYARGTNVVVKERLNAAIRNYRLSVNKSDVGILIPLSTVIISDEDASKQRVNMEDVLNVDKTKMVRLSFPASNTQLNKFIRGVMGEDLTNIQIPNREKKGVILKSLVEVAEDMAEAIRKMR